MARQFAVLYPKETAGLVFVDALPLTAQPRVAKAIAIAHIAELLAAFGLLAPILPWAARHILPVTWAFSELDKLACKDTVLAEWSSPRFYAALSNLLSHLPGNLHLARQLNVPADILTIALHSDYPDPTGRRIENAGHWIQVDQPDAVAAAVREILTKKGV